MLPTVITEMENVSDRQFMADVYENYHRLMYRTAAKCAADRDEQDEAVQDALVRLIAKVSLLRELDRPRLAAYIVRTVRNTALTRMDSQNREKQWTVGTDIDTITTEADDSRPPEDLLLRGELQEDFRQVWAGLPERDKLVLESRYIFHESSGELAQRLGCQPDSVRMALTRARRAVITELERRQGHEPARTVEGTVRG